MVLHLRSLFAVLAALVTFAPARAADPPTPLAELSFADATGNKVAWKDLSGKNATVVCFLSFDCPMSAGYAKTLADLATASEAKGVKFVCFCPSDDAPAKVAESAAEYKLGFVVFKDEKLRAADALG